jgi:Tfp pilus assembly protein PilX
MKPNLKFKSKSGRNRGVALVTALLILSLFTVMTLSMVIATTSDTLIDGYYRNARGSFYAADSGLNVARQYLINQFAASVPNPYTAFSTTVPISSGTETTILSNLNNTSTGFGAYQSMLGSQTASWTGSFKVDSANTTLGTPTCVIHYSSSTGTVPTCTSAGNGSATYYSYSYPYKLTVLGRSNSNETNTVQEQGTIMLTVNIVTNSTTTNSFAAWGMFIDQNSLCNGSYLVPGTITGPVFTNGGWTFGTGATGYIFTDAVGSHASNLGYQYSDGTCHQTASHPDSYNSQNINPSFQSGVNLNQQTIALPGNSFNQKRAVLDGIGTGTTDPTNTEMNAALKNISKTAYPTAGASSGVYLAYNVTGPSNTCPCTMTGGGIYVAGNASVTITASGSTAQVYTIVNNSTTTTVTVDTAANTTTIQSGASTQVVTGVPTQKNTSGVFQRNATMLYVDGDITALKGGGEGVGSIQDSTALDVVADGDVTITGDIRYVHEPVTLVQSGSTPPDTLIPANDHLQTLGIFTANGNINLANTQTSTNLQIDASIAAIAQGGSGGLVNTGNSINTLTIVGGRIQNTIQNIGATTRNVWFDRRYASGGFAPPWFPSTSVTSTTTYANPVPIVSASRSSWVNTTAQ